MSANITAQPPTLAELVKAQKSKDSSFDRAILNRLSRSLTNDPSFKKSLPWRGGKSVTFCPGVNPSDFSFKIECIKRYDTGDCEYTNGSLYGSECERYTISARRAGEKGKKCRACQKLRRSVVVKNKSDSANLLVPLSDVKSRSHPSNTSRLDQIPKKALKARVRKLKKDLVALQKRFDRLKKRMENYREIPIEIAPKSKLFLQEAMHVVLNDSDCRASLVNELLKFEAQECSGGRNDIDLEPTMPKSPMGYP